MVHENARKAWNKELGKIEVEGGTNTEQTIFYTALYHSYLTPNLFSDVKGEYKGFNNNLEKAEGYKQ